MRYRIVYVAILLACSLYSCAQQLDSLRNIYPMAGISDDKALNVFGEPLQMCCLDPVTGYYRNGQCLTDVSDYGTHIVCARVTDKFLDYSKKKGNDLITPKPQFNFPGLKTGDQWCLCISRWYEAHKAGVAPPIDLHATNIKALEFVPLEILKAYSLTQMN